MNSLNPLEPRYSLFDVDIKHHKDGQYPNSIIFFSWSPDYSKVKLKVIYGAYKSQIKNQFDITMR